MSAIDRLFQELRACGRKAFMPFVTAGDPDLEFTADVLRELVARGSNLCELGIPYSDPIADGPVIQASYSRALDQESAWTRSWKRLAQVTPTLPAPVVTMVSYSIVYRRGLEAYVEPAKAAGAAGAIVPDLPLEEAGVAGRSLPPADFSLIQLLRPPPRATVPGESPSRRRASSITYRLPASPVSGPQLPPEIVDNVAWLREQTPLPICIGFGISRPEHVRMLAPVADGLIVGSAIVRRVAEAAHKPVREVLTEIGDYAGELLAAMGQD